MVRVATILNGIDFEIAFRMKDDSMEKVREDFMCAWGWLNHMFLYCKSTKNPKELYWAQMRQEFRTFLPATF